MQYCVIHYIHADSCALVQVAKSINRRGGKCMSYYFLKAQKVQHVFFLCIHQRLKETSCR